ncbi:MAG TPA: BON domain-containing protein [Pirellulales bacterium]|jgi:osmotically-inducible protein OsmY|nr:BON domain-containing protein [Pirellulales bacterium]
MDHERNRPALPDFLLPPAAVYPEVPRPPAAESTDDARSEKLAARIARVVKRRTAGSVQNLRVEVRRDGVFLDGQCASFYSKQLAQQAAMGLTDERQLTNRIEVV